MHRAPPTQPSRLPPFPDSLDVGVLRQDGSVSEWTQLFSDLGFTPWKVIQHKVEGDTLDRHVERQAIVNHEKVPRHKQSSYRPSLSSPHHTHVWLHPSGVIAILDTYFSSDEWRINDIKLEARQDCGFADANSCERQADGSSWYSTSWSSRTNSQSLPAVWEKLTNQALVGELLPFDRWLRADNGWRMEDALDWKGLGVPVPGVLNTPSDRYRAKTKMIAKHRDALMEYWKPLIESAPFGFGSVLASALKGKIVSAYSSQLKQDARLPQPLRAWQNELNEVIYPGTYLPGQALSGLLKSLNPPVQWLDAPERALTSGWLKIARPTTSVSKAIPFLKQHGAASIADGKVGLLDMLLAQAMLPGSVEKAAVIVGDMSDAQLLARMTNEDAFGYTMGMQVALALMKIPQRRCAEEDLESSQKALLRLLDSLVARVGVENMVLQTDRHTVWEGALGMTFNAPMDEDLIVHHHQRMQAWLSWAQGHGVALPNDIVGEVTSTPSQPLVVPVLADFPTFDSAWKKAGGDHPRRLGDAVDRWNLLEPVRRHLRHRWLQDALDQPSQTMPSRPRM